MKNAYAKKLINTKNNAYTDGVWDGMVNEIVDTNDPIVTDAHIKKALMQIRGKEWEK